MDTVTPHQGTAAPGTERAPRELRRVVAADAAPRRLGMPATMLQLFLRFDPTSDLPHIVETEAGKPVARFASAGDLAIFASRDHKTLPIEYVLQYTGGQ